MIKLKPLRSKTHIVQRVLISMDHKKNNLLHNCTTIKPVPLNYCF